jgi:hypothetical protein
MFANVEDPLAIKKGNSEYLATAKIAASKAKKIVLMRDI